MRHGHQVKLPRNVIVIAFVALASGLGQDLIAPALPAYLTLLGVGAAGIGLADGLLQGATNVFRFVSGMLSDRIRERKGLVFLGYAISSAARPLLSLAGSFGTVTALRVLDGVGKGMKDAPRDALVAGSSEAGGRGRAFGFQRLVDTAGSVIGPLIATAVLVAMTPSLAAYRTVFALSALPGAIALALIWFGVREPRVAAADGASRPRPLPGVFWAFAAIASVAMLTKINDSLFLARGGTMGIPPVWMPAVFAGFTAVYALLSYPIGILSDKVGKAPLIAAGWIVLAAVEFGFSRASTLVPALALFAGYGLFYALTEGSARAFIADIVPEGGRGTAYAVYHTLTGVALIAGGFGLGRLWEIASPETAFAWAALGSLASGIALLLLLPKVSALTRTV